MGAAWFDHNMLGHLITLGFQVAVQPLLMAAGLRSIRGFATVLLCNVPIIALRVVLHFQTSMQRTGRLVVPLCMIAKPIVYALLAGGRSALFEAGPLGCLPWWPPLVSVSPPGTFGTIATVALGVNAFLDGWLSGALGNPFLSKLCIASALLLSLLAWGYIRRELLLGLPAEACQEGENWHVAHAHVGQIFPDPLVAAWCCFTMSLGLLMAHVAESTFRSTRLREAQMERRMEQLKCEKMRVDYDHSMLLQRRVQALRRASAPAQSVHASDQGEGNGEGSGQGSGASSSSQSGGPSSDTNGSFLRRWGVEREHEIERERETRMLEELSSSWGGSSSPIAIRPLDSLLSRSPSALRPLGEARVLSPLASLAHP